MAATNGEKTLVLSILLALVLVHRLDTKPPDLMLLIDRTMEMPS